MSAAPEITTLHRHDLSNAMSAVTTAMQVTLMTPNPEIGRDGGGGRVRISRISRP
jgi:hypothetical protein